jgi:hypothetical protein
MVLVLCTAEFVTIFDFSIVTMSLAGVLLAVVARSLASPSSRRRAG